MYEVASTYSTTRCWPRQRYAVSCGVARRLEDELGFHDGGKARQGLGKQHKGCDGCPHLRRRDVLINRGSGQRASRPPCQPVDTIMPPDHVAGRSRTITIDLHCPADSQNGPDLLPRPSMQYRNHVICWRHFCIENCGFPRKIMDHAARNNSRNYSRCRDWGLLTNKNSIPRSPFGAWLQSVHMHEIKLFDRSERYGTIDIDCASKCSRGREVGISPIAQDLRFC